MDKSDKPMTLETVKELMDAVKRINDAVEAGRIPRLDNEFEMGIYRRSKEWCALGNGSIHRGIARWTKNIKRRNEQRLRESPIWILLMTMYDSPNPSHRTLAEMVGRKLSYTEFSSLVNEILPQEMEKSAQELPPLLNEADNEKAEFERLAIQWVNRPEIPYKNAGQFLQDNSPNISRRTFYRIVLAGAYKNGSIGKSKGGRYIRKK